MYIFAKTIECSVLIEFHGLGGCDFDSAKWLVMVDGLRMMVS